MDATKKAKMIVTDFDANGGGLDQDYLWFEGKAWNAYQAGDDTKIQIDGGGLVILRDVDRGDISMDDFKMVEIL